MVYALTCQVVRIRDGWTSSVCVPTFFLDASIQGIVDASHAERIASTMLNPFNDASLTIHAYAAIVDRASIVQTV